MPPIGRAWEPDLLEGYQSGMGARPAGWYGAKGVRPGIVSYSIEIMPNFEQFYFST
jgi:hypothetical protein